MAPSGLDDFNFMILFCYLLKTYQNSQVIIDETVFKKKIIMIDNTRVFVKYYKPKNVYVTSNKLNETNLVSKIYDSRPEFQICKETTNTIKF